MWLDWLVFCEYGFSVFALWCPLATPTILLGFLLPWAWGISSRLLQQSAAISPYLGRWVSPHRRPSWPSMWDSSSRPSWAGTATAPGNSSRRCLSYAPGATQDGRVMVERFDRMWSTREGMANQFSILALRTPGTVWKGKMIGYWQRNTPGQ